MAETASQALRDTHLLLEGFATSPWRSLDVASGAMRLSISRMSAVERAGLPAPSPTPACEVGPGPGRLLTAPHVATLRDIAAVGSRIPAGEVYATLEVLGETIELRTGEELRVVSLLSQPGDLVEFGSAMMEAT